MSKPLNATALSLSSPLRWLSAILLLALLQGAAAGASVEL